jgi:hypothetical protein
MRYGYAHVSTIDQKLDVQEAALKAAGCDVIRVEKASGTSRTGRPELETLLGFMRKGDELMVTRVDRLARSIGDLQDIVRGLKAKGVALRERGLSLLTDGGFKDHLSPSRQKRVACNTNSQASGMPMRTGRGSTGMIGSGFLPSVDLSPRH